MQAPHTLGKGTGMPEVGRFREKNHDECKQTGSSDSRAQQQRGRVGNLLVGEVRIFADLAIDCTRQVAQLHVSEADK